MDAVCTDLESSPLAETDKVLFRYLRQVIHAPASVTQSDVDAVKAAGFSEAAILDAATVCAIFNFFNRWVDAAGVPDVPPGYYEDLLATRGDLRYSP